jgi:hypothetical protein
MLKENILFVFFQKWTLNQGFDRGHGLMNVFWAIGFVSWELLSKHVEYASSTSGASQGGGYSLPLWL